MVLSLSGGKRKEIGQGQAGAWAAPKARGRQLHAADCFGGQQPAKSRGKSPVYYVLGQTESGRHLFCVIIQFSGGKGLPVTARPMIWKEKESYSRWKNQ